MSTPNPAVLSSRDVNVSPTKASASGDSLFPAKVFSNKAPTTTSGNEDKPRSLEHHRQVLKNRLEAEKSQAPTYISPSDTIMSPCTAKLSAYKNKHFMKAKPQSLFSELGAEKEAKPAGEKDHEDRI